MIVLGVLAGGAVACGQVTGLSDDYVYDLAAEGGATADAGDASKADAGTDATAVPDATTKCSPSQTLKAAQKLSGDNGAQICKTCLATACCTEVDTCTNNGDCNQVLTCKLDCTTKQASQRSECFRGCTVNGGTPTLFTNSVGSCSTASCKQECSFQ
jgi:hypothetical protein